VVDDNIPKTNVESDTVTITIFDKNSSGKTFDDDVALKIMEETGINIELVDPTEDSSEKLNLMLATKTYPDIVLMGQGEIVNRYIEAGAFIELDDLIKEYAPNVTQMYGDVLDKTKYSDGKNYWLAVWYGLDSDASAGVLMRRDYLAEIVGYERACSPEAFTQSEYMEILRKFKKLHPEINGKESIALSLDGDAENYFGTLKGMFGIKSYYQLEDGTIEYNLRDPQYLKSLLFLNDLYMEGLLDKQWVIDKTERWEEKLIEGRVFSTFNSYWDLDTANSVLKSRYGEDAQFYSYKVVADGLSEDETTYNGRSSLGWDAIGITDNCKNVETAMKLVDYLASEEGQYLLMWGVEGEHWTMQNGVHVPNEDVLDALINNFDDTSNKTGIRKWTWFTKNGYGSDGTPYDLATKYRISDTAEFANQSFGELDSWDTSDFIGLEPAGNSELGLEWQKILDIFDENCSKVINANSNEEATEIFNNMIEQMDAVGFKECEEYMNGVYMGKVK
jgi:putative aldouronate transport system substrate-binding protein